MNGILIAAAIVGGSGIIIGIFLGVFGEKFKVEVNPLEVAVREVLPGNNCGGCGYAGCDGLAAAIASGASPVTACPVGGPPVAEAIAKIMGIESVAGVRLAAYVRCSGNCEVAKDDFIYTGVSDCKMAVLTQNGGPKSCKSGCMGFGSCVSVCEFDAVHIHNGIAVVDTFACKACGKCVTECPKALIQLRPAKGVAHVTCSSHEKGKAVMDVCKVGCIGCGICEKQCAYDAIRMEENLPVFDYTKCTGCGKCAEKCPKNIIYVS